MHRTDNMNLNSAGMRTLSIILALITLLISCEKSSTTTFHGYTARIAGYDLNCSTCILSFPFDSNSVINELGSSPENLYQAVNLNKSDLKVGHMLKVEVRKAEPAESPLCLALYPSSSYENVFVTRFEEFDTLGSNDTIILPIKECRFNTENQTYICFESVINDSRCPEGAECFWAGDAKVKFKYIRLNEDPVFFNLNTNTSFTNDSIIDGYRYTLVNLFPYPSLIHHTDQKECRAELLIEKVTR
jgi:hypothetical protein